ncbi:hypothetical protein KAR48_21170 [bacterium]|nr:hypothetical protein [bacterium]
MSGNELELKYKLINIETIKFVYDSTQLSKCQLEDTRPVIFYGHKVDQNNEIINIRVGVKVCQAENSSNILAELVVDYHYKTIGIQSAEVTEDGLLIPGNFLVTLFSIAYSTTRGIFYEKFTNVFPKYIILPIINPNEYFETNDWLWEDD